MVLLYTAPFKEDLLSQYPSPMDSIYLASAIESGVFLFIYLLLATYVLNKVRCTLHIDAYITMFIFMACSISNLICFIWQLYEDDNNNKQILIEIPTIVASGMIMAILFWYTY